MATTGFYVDGFNLYHSIQALERPALKWLNLKGLAESFLRPGDALVGVCYFTAVVQHPPGTASRHRRYIDALRAQGVEIITSKFQRVEKYCRQMERGCPFQEEKQTDVGLATRYVVDAIRGVAERVILVTADSDQIPAIEAVQTYSPNTEIQLVIPPGRRSTARQLSGLFVTTPIELTSGRLAANLLPKTVYGPTGKIAATCPQEWS